MMEMLGKIRWRMLLAVAFPVGVGTGLLPQPMVVVQMPDIHEKEQILPGAIFIFSMAGKCDSMSPIWQRMI